MKTISGSRALFFHAFLFSFMMYACASKSQANESSATHLAAASLSAVAEATIESGNSLAAKRTVTTIVDADTEAEAIAKGKKRYPKCKFIGVRKSGNHYIVTFECTS